MGCPALHIDSRFSAYTPKLEVVPKRTTPKKVFKCYPYGMLMPGRFGEVANSSNRYGFNGMEKDNEIKVKGNSYTTPFRQLDTRLGRWLSIDPVTYPQYSPYSAFDNNPIYFTDASGADSDPPEKKKDPSQRTTVSGETGYIADGSILTYTLNVSVDPLPKILGGYVPGSDNRTETYYNPAYSKVKEAYSKLDKISSRFEKFAKKHLQSTLFSNLKKGGIYTFRNAGDWLNNTTIDELAGYSFSLIGMLDKKSGRLKTKPTDFASLGMQQILTKSGQSGLLAGFATSAMMWMIEQSVDDFASSQDEFYMNSAKYNWGQMEKYVNQKFKMHNGYENAKPFLFIYTSKDIEDETELFGVIPTMDYLTPSLVKEIYGFQPAGVVIVDPSAIGVSTGHIIISKFSGGNRYVKF